MYRTRSATPLDRVKVEAHGPCASDVWLFDDIVEVSDEDEYGTQTFWEAFSVCGTVQGAPSVEEIEEGFDAWWERLEEASLTAEEKLGKLEAQVLFTALMTDTEV